MNTMIKLKLETREVLNTLKVVDRESYDDVIKRLILATANNEGALTETTKKMIEERLKSKREGRVKTINQIIEKMKEKNGEM